MSLLSSIFGEATSLKNIESEAPNLFGNTAIPPVLPRKSPSKAKAEDEINGKSKPKKEETKNGDDGDASVTSSSSSRNNHQNSDANGEEESLLENLNEKQTEQKRLDDEKRTIFVGNLPPDITRKALASIFKSCGSVSSARLRSMAVAGIKLPPEQAGNQKLMKKVCVNTGKLVDDAPKKSAQGYVVFESESSLANALKLNNTIYQSHTIRVDYATPTIEPSKSVFVGNLPYAADEESLRQHFLNGLGEGDRKSLDDEGEAVTGVRIIRDKETQKCKGFGYVTLRDASLVTQALQMHGTSYMKRELRVLVSGKRFKGKRGGTSPEKLQRRSFEGLRAVDSSGSSGKKLGGKRKSENTLSSGKAKTRRARSEKKSSQGPMAKAGISKRAKTEKKVNKRVKKLEKRSAKGMGKQKK